MVSNHDRAREYIGDNVFAPLEARAIEQFAAWLDRHPAIEAPAAHGGDRVYIRLDSGALAVGELVGVTSSGLK